MLDVRILNYCEWEFEHYEWSKKQVEVEFVAYVGGVTKLGRYRRLIIEAIEEILDYLPNKRALEMMFFEYLSTEEVSKKLELSVPSLMRIRMCALHRLATKLNLCPGGIDEATRVGG